MSDFESPHLGKKVMVRCDRSGVFYGTLEKLYKTHAVIKNARRIWYWSGAASISELAMNGTSDPSNCKFPEAVDLLEVTDVKEIDGTTEKAQKSIEGVPVWKA